MALAAPSDQHHQRAVATARRHSAAGGRWTSSVLVLAEFHTHALRRQGAVGARTSIGRLLQDPTHEWLDVTVRAASDATTAWLERFQDQAFSLTDAVSFELMRRHGVTHAFAFDQDFVTAGFALLE